MNDVEHTAEDAFIGLCFLPKKLPRVLTPQLSAMAAAVGLHLVALDPHAGPGLGLQPGAVLPGSTAAQGQAQEGDPTASAADADTAAGSARVHARGTAGLQPPGGPQGLRAAALDVIVHKLHKDAVWEAALAAYAAAQPATVVLDPLPAIQATEDRAVMLTAAVPASGLTLRVPILVHAPATSGQGLACSGRGAGEEAGSGRQEGRLGGGELGGQAGQPDMGVVEVRVEAPPQVVVESPEELRRLVDEGSSSASGVAGAGLRPPLVLKTRRTDAASGSGHGVAVVRSWAELEEQAAALQPPASPSGSRLAQPAAEPAADAAPAQAAAALAHDHAFEPLVVQQYVPHRQALYKVYVLGRHVRVERRATLTAEQVGAEQGGHGGPQQSMPSVVHRISTTPLAHATAGANATDADGTVRPAALGAAPAAATDGSFDAGASVDEAVMAAVARAMSGQLSLTMFNFDMVLPSDQSWAGGADVAEARHAQDQEPQLGRASRRLRLCVVDVNYWPGFDKLDGWEAMLVEHLRAAADRALATRRRRAEPPAEQAMT